MPLVKQSLELQLTSLIFNASKTSMFDMLEMMKDFQKQLDDEGNITSIEVPTSDELAIEFATKFKDLLAGDLATIIDSYIRTATVTVPPGVAVTTAGSAVTQSGATIAPGIGTIS